MKTKIFLWIFVAVAGMAVALSSCGKDGVDGRDGKDGKDGKDGDKGDKGDKGDAGADAVVAISDDGFWVVNGEKTNVKAEGAPGENGRDGADGADGADGITPTVTISSDGFWVINGAKTDVKAQGETGPAGPSNTVVVTFNADNGAPAVTQTVLRGAWAAKPEPPVKVTASQASGLYDNYGLIFDGWYAAGATQPYNFDQPVNANLTLTARWGAAWPYIDVSAETGANLVEKAISYAKANAAAGKAFTLFVESGYPVGAQSSFPTHFNLTIIGTGAERTLTYNGDPAFPLFTLNTASASLTLGNNITLRGISNGTTSLVHVTGGTFTMEAGSKITAHTTSYYGGAVYAGVAGTRLIINGGEISGNTSTNNNTYAAGGVVINSATFIMTGGKITGNLFGAISGGAAIRPADVSVSQSATSSATLSGAAEIGSIKLWAATSGNSSITVGAYNPPNRPFIDLVSASSANTVAQVKGLWLDKVALKSTGTLTAADVGKFETGIFIGVNNTATEAVSASHTIAASGANIGKVVANP